VSAHQSFDALAKTVFRALGLEVQRLTRANTEEAILKVLLNLTSPAAVMDVGANIGQYARSLRRLGYAGLIVSFEALPYVHARLTEAAKRDSDWIVAPCAALGSIDGTVNINVSANTASSSLLPMRDLHVKAAPESAYIGTETVRITRIDSYSATALVPAVGSLMLKIDTQGYEKEVLDGATNIIDRVAAVQIELSLTELYEGSPSLPEMILLLRKLGFELFNVSPGFKDKVSGRLLQMDGFFVRSAFL
jgi:FkbM family methyltransferase